MDGVIPFVISSGALTLARGIAYRIFKEYPAIISNDSFENTTNLLCTTALLGSFPEVKPMSEWEWLKSIKNGRRRRALVKAWNSLKERGEYHPDFHLISLFVKTENQPWFKPLNGLPDVDACEIVCRLIHAPHDETHIVAGPYLKPLTLDFLRQHGSGDTGHFVT